MRIAQLRAQPVELGDFIVEVRASLLQLRPQPFVRPTVVLVQRARLVPFGRSHIHRSVLVRFGQSAVVQLHVAEHLQPI